MVFELIELIYTKGQSGHFNDSFSQITNVLYHGLTFRSTHMARSSSKYVIGFSPENLYGRPHRFEADGAGLMTIHKIPVNKLSAKALRGVINEFISRDGTDYGEMEVSWETKFRHVKDKLKNGSAILIYDDETETTNILLTNDPVLKKLDVLT